MSTQGKRIEIVSTSGENMRKQVNIGQMQEKLCQHNVNTLKNYVNIG